MYTHKLQASVPPPERTGQCPSEASSARDWLPAWPASARAESQARSLKRWLATRERGRLFSLLSSSDSRSLSRWCCSRSCCCSCARCRRNESSSCGGLFFADDPVGTRVRRRAIRDNLPQGTSRLQSASSPPWL